ncbi:MAG TPA: hypothetical protein VK335_21975 [Bryobacteraceae bacterium]|nr:hypothetical protein [Bryobacteraceae bacterium]
MAKPRHARRLVTAAPQPRTAALTPTLQAAVVAALVLSATLPVTTNVFVTLDDVLYLGNPSVVSGLTPASIAFAFGSVTALYWHPVAWLSHEADVSLFGLHPAGHHLTSALLHAVAAGLLFLLLRKLGAGTWSSAGGSLLWAIHPLRVESFACGGALGGH